MMGILAIDLCLLVEEYVFRAPGCEAKQNEILELMSETEPFSLGLGKPGQSDAVEYTARLQYKP